MEIKENERNMRKDMLDDAYEMLEATNCGINGMYSLQMVLS